MNIASNARDVLVLSGGGSAGACQAGMLETLAASGYRPDLIVGVSAGALNGVYLAADWSAERAAELVAVWESLPRRGPFQKSTPGQAWAALRKRSSLHDSSALVDLVTRCCPVADLADLAIPLAVGAVGLQSGALTWWTSGQAVQRLCASAALPGLLAPVAVDGELFVDGGVVANVPVQRAVAAKPERVVVLDVSADASAPSTANTALSVMLRAWGHTRSALTAQQLAGIPDDVEVRVIRSLSIPTAHAADFSRATKLAATGRASVADELARRPLLPLTPEMVGVARSEPVSARVHRWLHARLPALGTPNAITFANYQQTTLGRLQASLDH